MVKNLPTQSGEEILSLIRDVYPFSCLSLELLHNIALSATGHVLPPDSFLFRQGEESKRNLFIIISGVAEVIVRKESGRSEIVDYRQKNDFCGETVLFTNKNYSASVRAITEIQYLSIPQANVADLIKNEGNFAALFSMEVMEHFHRLLSNMPAGQGLMKGLIPSDNNIAGKRAHELMHKPVITCSPLAKADELAEFMSRQQISSIVLVDKDGRLQGYVSEKDLVDKVVAQNALPRNMTAREIANLKPVCVDPDSTYYQVLLEMIKEQVKHAIVVDHCYPIGIITVGDLVRSRKTEIISLVNELRMSLKLDSLAALGKRIEQVLNGLVLEKATIPEILDIITEFYDQLTGKVIDLVLEEMMADYGPPPVKFCWVTMGSNGRREQFLQTDQDNALIYECVADPETNEKSLKYFAILAEKVVNGLHAAGFSLCPGQVMASNPLWRGHSLFWKNKVKEWVNYPRSLNIRYLTIFLDFRPVYGYYPLAEELRFEIDKMFTKFPLILSFLAKDAVTGKLPVNFLGSLVGVQSSKSKNEIDLKINAAVYFVDLIRILAVKACVPTTNTLDRLAILEEKSAVSSTLYESLVKAYQTVMHLRIKSNLQKLKAGDQPDNVVLIQNLSTQEKKQLKEAIKPLETLIAIVKEDYIH